MGRRAEILRRAVGLDYGGFERDGMCFDYEALLGATGYALDDVARIQATAKVGRTPLLELPQLTRLARAVAAPGKGARILLKDEAANPSGSFKARRAAVAVHEAGRLGYREVRLDSLPDMAAAMALYLEAGFTETARYYDTPVAGTRFFVRLLQG